jgi:transposase
MPEIIKSHGSNPCILQESFEPQRGTAKRLHLEQLPGYAPDLNPDEGIWNDLKRVELGNVCCTDLDDLSAQLIRAKERLRLKRAIIRSCSRQCGYSD